MLHNSLKYITTTNSLTLNNTAMKYFEQFKEAEYITIY